MVGWADSNGWLAESRVTVEGLAAAQVSDGSIVTEFRSINADLQEAARRSTEGGLRPVHVFEFRSLSRLQGAPSLSGLSGVCDCGSGLTWP